MSCPHAATTTIGWMEGEAPESHGLHVASCEECEQVLAEYEVLFERLGLVRGGTLGAPVEVPRPANRSMARWGLGITAAVVLVSVGIRELETRSGEESAVDVAGIDSPVDGELVMGRAALFESELDEELQALDLELEALASGSEWL